MPTPPNTHFPSAFGEVAIVIASQTHKEEREEVETRACCLSVYLSDKTSSSIHVE